MTKPLLLLDVDGPLNPYAGNPPRGDYKLFHMIDKSFTDAHGNPWTDGLRVWLDPGHGRMLLALTELVDLVWATAWEDLANKLIGPELGLPELPVIRFPKRQSYPFGQIFKRGDVEAYVEGRAFAWFDDDFQLGDYQWGAQRTERGVPTFLRWVDPAIGLTQLDFDLVADWARDPAILPTAALGGL